MAGAIALNLFVQSEPWELSVGIKAEILEMGYSLHAL